MKVILLQDVARIGKRFEITNVPDGHALNFLIPRKMAESATPENVKRIEERKGKQEAGRAAQDAELKETLQKLEGATIAILAPADAEGHLFKSVKAKDIAAKISETIGTIAEEAIMLPELIKSTGSHEVTAEAGEARAAFTVSITAK